MALSITEATNPPRVYALLGKNYEITLNQSTQDLLAQIREGTPNLSRFIDIFYGLMQAKIDPPLESIWVYAALWFRGRKSIDEDPLHRISVTKDLFQLTSACSGSCSSSKSIVLLAPIIFELHKLVVELLGNDLGSEREKKKTMGEIKSVIKVILSYISVCCSKDLNEESKNPSLIIPFSSLVSVWMDANEGSQSFLPLVSRGISDRACDVNYLAGLVIVEAFLLKLCLDLQHRVAGIEFEKELRSWAVGSITAFRNFYFFEIIVNTLLEPTLPVTSILCSKDAVRLRQVLLDAVILVDYSFLNPERALNASAQSVKSLAISRLIVTHEAIESSREDGDQRRAISYTSAFSSSRLPSQIMKWIQIGMDEGASRPNVSSPKALIQWLLNLEAQGIKVFEDSLLKHHARLAVDNPRGDYGLPSSEAEEEEVGDDLLFYVDDKGDEDNKDEEMRTNESISAAFVTAANSMKLIDNGAKKRKERASAGNKRKIKYVKYDVDDDSGSAGERHRSSSIKEDGSSSESEVDNPVSDSDVERRDQ